MAVQQRVFLLASEEEVAGEATEEEDEAVHPQCGGGRAQLHVTSVVCGGQGHYKCKLIRDHCGDACR